MKNKISIVIGAIIGSIVLSIVLVTLWYSISLKAVSKKANSQEITIEIASGTSTKKIVKQLKKNGLIKNELSTKIYIKINKIKNLQAGKYTLDNSMSVKEIIKNITSGNVTNEEINITFLEGKNIRWIAKKIESETNNLISIIVLLT